MKYTIELPSGTVSGTLQDLEMKRFELGVKEDGAPLTAKAVLEPERSYDLGAGKGTKVERELAGGVTGIILDGRGRPFDLSDLSDAERVSYLKRWMTELDIYPAKNLEMDK
jgi:hypothetical protein